MNIIISKQNIIVFNILVLLFLFSILMSCTKKTDEIVGKPIQVTNANAENVFSKMPLEEKEAYCEKLIGSFEYQRIGRNIRRFIPISMPALNDEKLRLVKTKSELLTWIKNNLEHTLFTSIEEAEELYKETEMLQKTITQMFATFDFSKGSSDIVFLNDYTMKRLKEERKNEVLKMSHSFSRKNSSCFTSFSNCLLDVQNREDAALYVCDAASITIGCLAFIFGGPAIAIPVHLACQLAVIYGANTERQQCHQAYEQCVKNSKK